MEQNKVDQGRAEQMRAVQSIAEQGHVDTAALMNYKNVHLVLYYSSILFSYFCENNLQGSMESMLPLILTWSNSGSQIPISNTYTPDLSIL
jgi:hypothetical protein